MKELKIGDIIKQRYALVQFLGSGSFGEVWLAQDQMTGRDVALKIYLSLDPIGVEEFQREYSNTVDLSSPYLLTPDYFDVHNRRPFLVMKYCANGSSSKLAGQISEDKLWAFIHDVASGLEVLHSQSDPIVHQDIKPDNILVDRSGRFLITDFGISKRLRATMRRQSKRDISSGAMPYMAPERFDSTPRLTPASDIWSLGASIYELATGELPFSGFGGAMQRNGADMPSLNARYSTALNEIMQCCLMVNTIDRPSAVELLNWVQSKKEASIISVSTQKSDTQQRATIHEPSTPNSISKSSVKSCWIFIVITVMLMVGSIFLWKSINYNKEEDKMISIPTDTIIDGNTVITEFTAEQQIQSSNSTNINGQIVHFYKGAFYYGNDIYPVMVGFITSNNRIINAIYKNVTYGGGCIVMGYQTIGNQIILSGKDGNNEFTMTLSAGEDKRLLGTATDGNKSMTVRLMPTSESFVISHNSNENFTSFKIGKGKISIPSFLTYKGESEEGGPLFLDSSEQIRLFVDYSRNQDIALFRDWVNGELGYGTTLISKDDCFVQSGYTEANEIYYCKAYMDNTTYPPIMYTAITIYPTSRRNEMDGLLAKIFNPFPNIK